MNWNRIIFILVLIPLGISNCDVAIGGTGLPFFGHETCGATEFGLTQGGGKSLQRRCGTMNNASLIDRNELADVCLANLFRPPNLPSIIDNTNNIGYHTVFVIDYRDSSNGYFRLVRFNAEYQMSTIPTDAYIIQLSQEASGQVCAEGGGSHCDAFTVLDLHMIWMSANFFTDFKLHVGNDQPTHKCRNSQIYGCYDFLCVYVAMIGEDNCLRLLNGRFAIRIKPNGNSNVYKTIGYPAVVYGSYGSSDQKKDHYYYIKHENIEPLLVRAQCTKYCADDNSDNAYCQDEDSCPAGFTSTTFSSSAYNHKLIGDYAYFADEYDGRQTICEKLYNSDKAAYASTNMIFDDRMGGKPHCDCALGYRWNVQIQICEKCQNGSSSIVCPRPCYNICERNEDCVIDTNGLEQCVCKPGHTLVSMYGSCKKQISCDNGTLTVSNGALICKCEKGFEKSQDGICVDISLVNCYNNLPACILDDENDTTCMCPNGSFIESGMCAIDCSDCGTDEECSIDESGNINCTCMKDYTRINSSDSCFHTLSCPRANETLRVTEDMGFICNCKEGYLKSDEGDAIVCLDYSNHKFIRVFCVLWLIVVMTIH